LKGTRGKKLASGALKFAIADEFTRITHFWSVNNKFQIFPPPQFDFSSFNPIIHLSHFVSSKLDYDVELINSRVKLLPLIQPSSERIPLIKAVQVGEQFLSGGFVAHPSDKWINKPS
jgi:hypothetical protein